jgi:hypothetical protein
VVDRSPCRKARPSRVPPTAPHSRWGPGWGRRRLSTGRWPTTAVDGEGNGTAWPGWTQIDGQWIEVPDDRDGTLIVEVSVNPTSTVSVTYPEATAACAAGPTISPSGEGAGGGATGGGGGGSTPTTTPSSPQPSQAGDGASDPSVAAAGGGLPRTGGDLLVSLVAGLMLVTLGVFTKVVSRRRLTQV